MEEIVRLVAKDQNVTESLTTIIAAVSQTISTYGDVTWLAQPNEHAVYVHATEPASFIGVVTHLEEVTQLINESLRTTGERGLYICEPDHDRHCLDIFYSRY